MLALFKNDTSEPELVAMLNEQLADFLESNTPAFVTKAVETLKTQSYGAGQTRKRDDDDDGAAIDVDDMDQPSKRQAYAGDEAMDTTQPDVAPGDGAMLQPLARPRRQMRVPKGWCRDYHTQGVCSRGASCKFKHSDDSITAPMMQGGFPGMPFMPGFMPPDGFPPEMAQMMPPPEQFAQMMQHMQAMAAADMSMRGRGAGRGRGRGGHHRGGHVGHAPAPRSQDTIVIENIPQEHLELAQVNDYFKRFGTITNIDVDAAGKKAVVTYATPAEAENAHKSPDVIFSNRFVKVYFQRLERPPPSKPNYMVDKGSNVYLAPSLRAESEAAPDSDKARQLELRKKKQALVQMQLAEQKSLLQKLEDKDLTPAGRKSIMTMLEKLSTDIKGATDMLRKDLEPSEAMDTGATTEELQAKLATLRQEAASLGLDASGHPSRGSFRGAPRGRGFGGRGFGSRGAPAFRGRGGAVGRSMTLDNRTTKLALSGVPQGYDADTLRTYAQQFGELNALERDGDRVVLTYKARASGERALRAAQQPPGLADTSLAWVEAPVVAPAAPPAAPRADAELEAPETERDSWKH